MQDEDNIKISDFGVAKILNTLSRATTKGKGTFNWMAPEAIRLKPHNNKVDIWSLGCTVYQMFVGKIPFHEEEDYSITLKAIKNELALTPPEHCSKHLRRFLKRTCDKDPSKRPSATELLKHSFSKVFQSCNVTNEDDTDSSEDEQSSSVEFAKEPKLSFPEQLARAQQTINLGVPITNWPAMFQGGTSHIDNDRYLSSKIPEYYAIQYAATISENWEHLFLQLDFTPEETAQELSDCSNDVKQTITNLLVKWVSREGEKATHKNLEAAMKKAEESNQLKVDWGEFLYILLDFKDNNKKEFNAKFNAFVSGM
ncbi:uncharacterized protein LOC131943260 [Physella acuta]|uniref:uncharacterized protein LOC131943260 n=1 Tax=Physella acuta TaxID=109671 RepID=UPI0027DDF14C|nr:uncharacterized protein LOC131943260 [Physella acuta]